MKKSLLTFIFAFISIFTFASGIPYGNKLFLTELNGKKIDSRSVYLTINKNDSTISGKSGCNNFNISFKDYNNNKCIKTKTGMGTLMACDDASMKLESEFLKTLQDRKIKIVTKGNTVSFKNWIGKTLAKFDIQTSEKALKFMEENEWKLFSLNNVGMDYGKASIKFDTKTNKVFGSTGCNNFFGVYKISGDKISFSELGTTKMACRGEQENKTENDLIKILSSSNLRFDLADQTLNFYDGNRTVLIYGIQK